MQNIEVQAQRSGEAAAGVRASVIERPLAQAPADPFEVVFRRMKDRVASHAPHDADPAQGRSSLEPAKTGEDDHGLSKGRESVDQGSIRSGVQSRESASDPSARAARSGPNAEGGNLSLADKGVATSSEASTPKPAARSGPNVEGGNLPPADKSVAISPEASTPKPADSGAGAAAGTKENFPGTLPESAKESPMRGAAESGQPGKPVEAGELGVKLDPVSQSGSFSTGKEGLFRRPPGPSELFAGRVGAAQAVPTPHVAPEVLASRAAGHVVEAGRGQLLDQIVQGVRVAHQGEASEITVHLRPDFLGKLSIRVLADDSGMRVEIRAENGVVRQLMQDNMADLQQRLSEKGLSFDAFGVFAEAGPNQRDGPEYSFRARAGEGLEAPQGAVETASEQAPDPILSRGGGLIDCFA